MKISKQDALTWFRFFASLPEGEEPGNRQMDIVYAVFSQIEEAAAARRLPLLRGIPGLKAVVPGGEIRPWTEGQPSCTLFVGPEERFPRGCRSCLLGSGLSAVRKSNRCDAACPFCYDYGCLDAIPPIGEGLWEIGGGRYREEDLPLLFALQGKPSGVAYVYLEPFTEIEKYYGIIRRFHEAGVYQHMYTNGIRATEERLAALGDAGLDELRFNLGASGASDAVIAHMAAAKKYIPMVGVETPMTREFNEAFRKKKRRILESGIDFMNCAELHLNENNLPNYWGENLYFPGEERWPIAVHDCSDETKFARDLHLRAREGGWFGQTAYGREIPFIPYEAFLPVLEDPDFAFVTEEPLPPGYRPGDLVL